MLKNKLLIAGILISISSTLVGQGVFDTDRLGYTGTATRYDSLADLTAGVNEVGTLEIGNRDIYIGHEEGSSLYAMGSWYYSINPNGSPGWGNVTGNTGPGYIQLYDSDGSTVGSSSIEFDAFDGTYWTEMNLYASGSNANYAEDYARFSYDSNLSDTGVFLSYEIDLTVGGLTGTETAPGLIEAFNHPTSVIGGMNAVFQNTSSSDPSKNGFYLIELEFNMENWAYENRDLLTYPEGGFVSSYFAVQAVPEPSTIGLLAMGGMGLMLYVRRRRK